MSTAPTLQIHADGVRLQVARGTSVAAALAQVPPGRTRTSVTGQPRAPLCGMGVCHECRVRIDGRVRLACQTLCTEGMQVHTDTGTARP
ncbi:succinate dehydrogenase/fumarate reductase-like Fe-S protein [Acidovorax soli]|uniref:Succinate dehydrogenase/fumarate reductase-like Fe-S protein n=1 Tax=Acidovorax soli TaxID=592050 RepID=A0A7X0UC60_9BURK|nr:(2Fe-2S)-binding protein [Acidovorax soli]MBB6563071.1 succinate dehydrogenase/fumarate reductase-like Fe-S protein [Acidovorax soli]